MQAIKFAIVGYGFIGKRHAEILRGHPDCELVAVCEPQEEKTADLEGVAVFREISDLLSAGLHLDVVCICTPNGVHADQAIAALERKADGAAQDAFREGADRGAETRETRICRDAKPLQSNGDLVARNG